MRILIDTNVLLDVALAREPHATSSAAVLRWAERSGGSAIAWHSLSTCAYLLKGGGHEFLEKLLRVVEVAPVATAEAKRALSLPMHDTDDALQAASALAWKADFIVTRNTSDYRGSPVRALTPIDFMERVGKLA